MFTALVNFKVALGANENRRRHSGRYLQPVGGGSEYCTFALSYMDLRFLEIEIVKRISTKFACSKLASKLMTGSATTG